jgi:hypothetical protein
MEFFPPEVRDFVSFPIAPKLVPIPQKIGWWLNKQRFSEQNSWWEIMGRDLERIWRKIRVQGLQDSEREGRKFGWIQCSLRQVQKDCWEKWVTGCQQRSPLCPRNVSAVSPAALPHWLDQSLEGAALALACWWVMEPSAGVLVNYAPIVGSVQHNVWHRK